MKLKYVTLLLLAAILISACNGNSNSRQLPYASELQDALDAARQSTGVIGISVAIIVPGYDPWLGVSGESHPGQPITPDMLFDMGSAGKMIVGPLVVKLAEDGLLSLDDPIREYLPDFPYADGSITIRQLLNHTNGLYMMQKHPDSPFQTRYADIDHDKWWTIDEIFTKLGGDPYFAPGEGWCYTQAGYQIATLIVEQVTGTPVAEAVKNRLFDPLGIDGIHLDFSKPVPDRFEIAHPWFDIDYDGEYEDVHELSRNWIASLSRILFYTSAGDFARWGHALFTGQVLNQASMDELLDFYHMDDWCGEPPFNIGYGLGVQEFVPELAHGQQAWGHMGSIQGYRAILEHLPQHGVTMVVMHNTNTDNATPILDGLLDVILSQLAGETKGLQPLDVQPVADPPDGASIVETFQKETLFCEHNPAWLIEAGPGDWIDISLEWVVGTDAAKAENAWQYHDHTITINGQEIHVLDYYTHEVASYTVICPDERLEIWAKGLSIYLPPLPPGDYEIKWLSQITSEFNNGWIDYKPGNFMEMTANLIVK